MQKPNKIYKKARKRLGAPGAWLLMDFLSDGPTVVGCLAALLIALWLLTR